MKNLTVTTRPVKNLRNLIGLTPQVLTIGCKVKVYSSLTAKVSYSGVITSLYSENNFICGTITESNGVKHESNTLGTVKKITMITVEKIYLETHEQVLNHALRVIKNFHDSEDVTQKVFIKIARLMKSDSTRFNPKKSALSTWVHLITNSAILDYFRTNHSDKYKNVTDFTNNEGKEVFEFEASKNSNADTEILKSETQKRIVAAFHDLKPKYRRVATLYFIRERSYEEISEMLNIPMGTVKGMLNRCREKLQETLKDLHTVRKVKEVATV